MSSLSERKARIFQQVKEEMMAAGAGGFTGAADPAGPVAGYDPVMGLKKKHDKKKKEKLSEARAKTREEARAKLAAHDKAMKDGGKSPYFKKQPKTDPWASHPSDAKAFAKEEVELEEARDGKSAKDKGYSLRDWFKGGGWKQTGGKYDGKPCAKQPGQTTKPFCRDADDRAAMSKEERDRRAAKKRREDPNADRKGKAKMVHEENLEEKKNCWPGYEKKGTKKMFGKTYNNCVKKEETEVQETEIQEGKKDACYHKVKARYDVWPSAYASGALVKCRKKGAANWGNKSKKKD